MASGKLLIYLLRRDLRVTDNPILHHLATAKDHGFTHLLPVYVFPSHQIELSGFLKDGEENKSPYPPARSEVGKFWRCGPHRAKFQAESVWDLKHSLEELGSSLLIRVGKPSDVLQHLISHLKDQQPTPSAVWMTEEKSSEEIKDQKQLASVCKEAGVDFKLWADEKYYIDDQDTGLDSPNDLPDVFTVYRKQQEPLRERPRAALPRPSKDVLPSLPDPSSIPDQFGPFVSVDSLEELVKRLLAPLTELLHDPPTFPEGAQSSHPFKGGETEAWGRIQYLIKSDNMTSYKDTRNGLNGPDFSTKLSGYLAIGCITARQIHHELVAFEDGTNSEYEQSQGYGQGENSGTGAVRFELLWRDYMRLCTIKFGSNLFKLEGFRQDPAYNSKWLSADESLASKDQNPAPEKVEAMLKRFLEGTTGMGFIDAAQRELYLTGYTSNRARQNVASFLTKHLGLDWRYGAEWYECMLVDYDVSSNWANWQYVAGVGNDPRGDARIFNPVKQAFDYDSNAEFVKMWLPELRVFTRPENAFQAWTASKALLEEKGLADNVMATDPLKRVNFVVDRRPGRSGRKANGRGRGPGGGGGGGPRSNGGDKGGDRGGDKGEKGDKGDRGDQGGDRGGDRGGRDGGRGNSFNRGGSSDPSRGGRGGPSSRGSRGGSSNRGVFRGASRGTGRAGTPITRGVRGARFGGSAFVPRLGARRQFDDTPVIGDIEENSSATTKTSDPMANKYSFEQARLAAKNNKSAKNVQETQQRKIDEYEAKNSAKVGQHTANGLRIENGENGEAAHNGTTGQHSQNATEAKQKHPSPVIVSSGGPRPFSGNTYNTQAAVRGARSSNAGYGPQVAGGNKRNGYPQLPIGPVQTQHENQAPPSHGPQHPGYGAPPMYNPNYHSMTSPQGPTPMYNGYPYAAAAATPHQSSHHSYPGGYPANGPANGHAGPGSSMMMNQPYAQWPQSFHHQESPQGHHQHGLPPVGYQHPAAYPGQLQGHFDPMMHTQGPVSYSSP